MKKFLIAALALVFSGSAMALDYEPQQGATFMGFLGMNATQIKNLPGYDGKLGGNMGARIDYVLPKAHGTYITAGVDWTQKGAKYKYDYNLLGEDVSIKDKYNLHYLEIPIRVGFRYNFSREVGVYGEFGPYFAMGVRGKHKVKVDADGDFGEYEDKESYNAFKKSTSRTNFQRWDAGLGFRVGAEYNQHYNLMLGCDWGITDMYRDDYRDVAKPGHELHNFNFTIALGYRF